MPNWIKSLLSPTATPPFDKSKIHKKEGDEHLKLGRLEDAAACYRLAVSMNPNYVDACVGLGFALSEQKQFGEAEEYLRKALSVDSENADAHYILGTISKSRNDRDGAIVQLTRALDIKPDFEFAYRDLASTLLESGQTQKAKDVLERATLAFPESAEFQFYLGNMLSHEGDYGNAIARYRKALSIQPGSAESHKNLADVLRKSGELDQAMASYQKAIWFEPALVDAHVQLGSLLHSQRRLDQAVECYQRAVALKPEDVDVQIGLGDILEGLGRIDEAISRYRQAVALDPERGSAHQYLGNALLARGATGEAIACFEQVVKLDPDSPVKHLIAALSGGDSERAPGDYVEKLFDDYANKFDSHLVGVLGYSVPEKLGALLQPYCNPDGEKWTILDLGCGTGLSGVAIAPLARKLVGVDLSTKMLEKARERNVYDRLEQLDLLTMMRSEMASSYDVIVAADVFVYLGKLDDLMIEAQRLLAPGGLFAFSVESLEALIDEAAAPSDGRDYRLNVTGRYAHSIAYLAGMAARNGFRILSTADTQSRLDKGKPVRGYLALWRSLADPQSSAGVTLPPPRAV